MLVKVGFGPLVRTLIDPYGTLVHNVTTNVSKTNWFVQGKLFFQNSFKKGVKNVDQRGKLIQNAAEIKNKALVPAWETLPRISRLACRYAVTTVARELRNRAGKKHSLSQSFYNAIFLNVSFLTLNLKLI